MKKYLLILLIFILAACSTPNQPITKESSAGSTSYKMISVDELSQALKAKDFLFVNVHIPVEGNIPGTDLDIAYNEIEKKIDKFPADKNSKIILYCRSGSMSKTAANTLASLGYTNVFDLEGGYSAWEAAGYQFPEE
jgi:rhodanese-related sulfurtransferase